MEEQGGWRETWNVAVGREKEGRELFGEMGRGLIN